MDKRELTQLQKAALKELAKIRAAILKLNGSYGDVIGNRAVNGLLYSADNAIQCVEYGFDKLGNPV